MKTIRASIKTGCEELRLKIDLSGNTTERGKMRKQTRGNAGFIFLLAVVTLSVATITNPTTYATPTTGYIQTKLVSDVPGFAPNTNSKLINPWGFSEDSNGQFRVAANGTGRGILLDAQGEKEAADIIIPPPAGSPSKTTSTPNGVGTNTTSDFAITFNGHSAPATLLFSTEDGTIAGWNPSLSQTRAVIGSDQSGSGAVYKGLALGSASGANYLYATNFHNGTVDVFDKNFALHTFSATQFTDPDAATFGFAPFGIQNINGVLFVAFAKQDADKHDDVAGPGNGFIDKFDTSGNLLARFASGTAVGGTLTSLNSPWGLVVAPAGFGSFSGDLLVGNFGDSHVSGFVLTTAAFMGQLTDTGGNVLVLTGGFQGTDTKGLWGIGFGNGAGGADTNALFFASGINDENDGLFGNVTVATGP